MAKDPYLAWDGFEYRDVQDENGVDLELLRHNLSLTVEERIAENDALWETFLILRNARRLPKSPEAA